MSKLFKFTVVFVPLFNLSVCLCYWLAGFDFNERSGVALSCFVICVVGSFILYSGSYDYFHNIEIEERKLALREKVKTYAG